MARVRGKDTGPEMRIRRIVYGMGYRYRLQRKDLPGIPDLVFPGLKKVIFIHGCFWHGHTCRKGVNLPKSNVNFWFPKLERNKARDAENQDKLRKMGWDILVIWECHMKDEGNLREILKDFLENPNR